MSNNLWVAANNLPFKTKSTIIAIALGVLPVVTIGAINYTQISNASYQQAIKTQKVQAAQIADKLNRFVLERNGDAQIIAGLPIVADPKISASITIENRNKVFDNFINAYQVYDSIAFFDLQGNPIVQSKGDKLNNHADRPYFQAALKENKTIISSPEISKTTGKVVVHFARAVKDLSTGQIIGVIRTRTPIDRLQSPITDFASKSENYHILDLRTNKIFISSNGEYADKGETAEMARSRTNNEVVFHTNKGAGGERRELLSAAKFNKLQGMEELPWVAIAQIDEQAAYIELQGLLWTILAGTAFTSVLTVGLSTFFADRIAKYIQRAIFTITTSASEIVDTVQLQEIVVNDQASSAIETTDTIDELQSISTTTAEQAEASATGAQQALSLAEAGTQAVQKTIHEMADLRDRVNDIATQIVSLSEQTGQITTVSDLVSDLAKQTNMLALKAAVEAARAGEQGKGFGVVAGEIRKLADESKKSAQKINNLAADIQSSINRTVMATDLGTKTVTQGIQLAENTATTFVGVADAVSNVFLNSQQISSSTKRQSTAIQQVLGAMTKISQESQESAVGMHRVKTSTKELNQIADELQAVVS
jgi:Methyl-accepting chemotaxis protein (MCP) signalling domain